MMDVATDAEPIVESVSTVSSEIEHAYQDGRT
jgi:hypothetical protein